MKLGIAGLPNVGKTSLFNLLTEGKSEVAPYPFTTIQRNIGVAKISDERFSRLVEAIKPTRSTPAQIEIVDIAGLVEGASRGEGLGNQFLANIRDVDLLIHLLRSFASETISHPYTEVDPVRDYEVIRSEFLLSDLEIIERRMKKLSKLGGEERKRLEEIAELLRAGTPPPLTPELKSYGLISPKPELIVINGDEFTTPPPLNAYPISIKLEEEMAGLPEDEKRSFRREYGLDPRGPGGIIMEAIGRLDMVFFYTIKGEEARAWIIRGGTKAIDAAGMIHSDMKKGFIKAEVASVEDIITLGGFSSAQEKGKVRTEGKDYRIKDGDVLLIRFHT
ncbi:redox-regulated ATPase YchF [candidate division WOR-3 bacterium]|uniref:Redox-regulated ATPase YchF n=1 Tax=candidate division WOR-3 bacterium TaxID=2052148 RepID=A0A660SJ20_UNCW3|nr:MAG: redox-regulated ATPase YchF [candidate division WOR-3 bacterium]